MSLLNTAIINNFLILFSYLPQTENFTPDAAASQTTLTSRKKTNDYNNLNLLNIL